MEVLFPSLLRERRTHEKGKGGERVAGKEGVKEDNLGREKGWVKGGKEGMKVDDMGRENGWVKGERIRTNQEKRA